MSPDLQVLPDGVFDRRADRWLGDDEIAALGIEAPADGHGLEERPADVERARLASILATARADLLSGGLHPHALHGRLAEKLPAPERPRVWRSAIQRALELGAHSADPMPTGFAALNTATRGGLRAAKLIVAAGAPGAGKTGWCVQVALEYMVAGHPVGILACDEDADGLLIRIGQQWGLVREDLERGVLGACRRLAELLTGHPIALVDADESEATIEDVAERVAATAKEVGKPGVLVVDSVQKVRCREHALNPARIERERVDATMRALKHVSRGMGLLTLATSEANRALYRGGADPKINPLAAAKESGSIEYAAALMMVLTSVPGESDLVDVAVPKNRIGAGREGWRMRFDRDRARFEEVDVTETEEADEEELERLEEARDARVEADAEKLLAAVLKARVKGARLTTKDALYELTKGRKQHKIRVVAHLVATGRLVGGHGRPFGPPEPVAPAEVPPQEDDG